LFALLSAPGADLLPTGTWEWIDCAEDQCAQLTIDGTGYLVLGFTDDGVQYSLASITEL
jgi:hypothetical protein